MSRGPDLRRSTRLALPIALLLAASSLCAQSPPGPIKLMVDASEAPRQILHARLVILAKPGPLTLFYPKWIPGEHVPGGPIIDLAGLKFSASGKLLAWRRDLVDMFAFHLDVPEGASAVEAQLDFLLTGAGSKFSSGASATSQLVVLSWNQVLLYPQGWPARELAFEPSLRLPEGWQFGTALPVEKRSGSSIVFKPVPLNTLVDSPVQAGAHLRVVELTPGENPPHEIDLAGDSEAAIAMSPGDVTHYKQLVAETGALFGARHYRDYHFLFTLSDDIAHFGLEHHESSDDRSAEHTLQDDNWHLYESDLLPHEFTHSWNGKFRRPAGLATSDFQQPMKGDLLWVYEGLTQYLGVVLAARSGIITPQQFREEEAYVAGMLDHRAGREWRSLQDTADAAQLLYGAPVEWAAWRRSTDFYEEGALIWLDVDTTIRRETHGSRSLNDFCKLFYGGSSGSPEMKPYVFDDVVAALKEIAPYDWASFLTERLNTHGPHAPLGGIENGGSRLIYTDAPNEFQTATEQVHKFTDLSFSLGMIVEEDGTIRDVIPGMPAAGAGLGPGMKVTAVDGHQWGGEVMREAVRRAQSTSHPIELLVANGAYYKTLRLDYHGGLRFPHLERQTSQPDLLGEIIKPLAPAIH
jgi:predicted metalloprotease with PDZ domain